MKEKKLIQRGLVFGIFFLLLAAMVVITVPMNVVATAPSTVWVDNDYYSGGANDGHSWGIDAFDNIQSGVNAVATGGTVHVYDGTYYPSPATTPHISISKSLTLQAEDDIEDVIIDGSSYGDIIRITANDVDIKGAASGEGFTIQNSGIPNPIPARWGAGIRLAGVSASRITGCDIEDIVFEDNYNGIRLYYAGDATTSTGNTFKNIDCTNNERDFILEHSNYNTFENIESTIEEAPSYYYIAAIALYDDSTYNIFDNIDITGPGEEMDGFYLSNDCDHNKIFNCKISDFDNGISLHGATNECNDNEIQGCDIDSQQNSCIYILNCDENAINYNNLGASGDSALYVIQLYSSSHTIIADNVIKAANVGIVLEDNSNLNIIDHNEISYCDSYGVEILSSSDTEITNNEISYCNSVGIVLESDSDSNTITYNEISYCDSYGVEILSSYSNEIHHNNFIENNGAGWSWDPAYIQAYDVILPPDSGNIWNLDYGDPLDTDIDCGNYWSDWGPVGSDELCGPNQDNQG